MLRCTLKKSGKLREVYGKDDDIQMSLYYDDDVNSKYEEILRLMICLILSKEISKQNMINGERRLVYDEKEIH